MPAILKYLKSSLPKQSLPNISVEFRLCHLCFVFLVLSRRIVTTEIVTKTKHAIIVSVMTKGNTQSLYLEEVNNILVQLCDCFCILACFISDRVKIHAS